jgi:hypothetical protein
MISSTVHADKLATEAAGLGKGGWPWCAGVHMPVDVRSPNALAWSGAGTWAVACEAAAALDATLALAAATMQGQPLHQQD